MLKSRRQDKIVKVALNVAKYDKIPEIPLIVGDVKFLALIDTGACRSIISDRIVNVLKGPHEINKSGKLELYDISNNKMKTGGKIKLKLDFQGDIIEQEFVIINDLQALCVLGMDAIECHELIINGKEKTVCKVKSENSKEAIEDLSVSKEIKRGQTITSCYVENTWEQGNLNFNSINFNTNPVETVRSKGQRKESEIAEKNISWVGEKENTNPLKAKKKRDISFKTRKNLVSSEVAFGLEFEIKRGYHNIKDTKNAQILNQSKKLQFCKTAGCPKVPRIMPFQLSAEKTSSIQENVALLSNGKYAEPKKGRVETKKTNIFRHREKPDKEREITEIASEMERAQGRNEKSNVQSTAWKWNPKILNNHNTLHRVKTIRVVNPFRVKFFKEEDRWPSFYKSIQDRPIKHRHLDRISIENNSSPPPVSHNFMLRNVKM